MLRVGELVALNNGVKGVMAGARSIQRVSVSSFPRLKIGASVVIGEQVG
jgi:hypothetical protein